MWTDPTITISDEGVLYALAAGFPPFPFDREEDDADEAASVDAS